MHRIRTFQPTTPGGMAEPPAARKLTALFGNDDKFKAQSKLWLPS